MRFMPVRIDPILVSLTCLACLSCLTSAELTAQEAGEIVFATSAIDPANPGDLTDTFTTGDHIYAVAYLDQSLLGIVGKSSAKSIGVEVFLYELKAPLYDYQQPSEAQLETATLTVSGDALQNEFLIIDIAPNPAAMTAYGNPDFSYKKFGDTFAGPVKFAEKLSRLETGEHTIIVKLRCNYNFVSEGQFTLTGDDFGVFAGMAKALNDAASGVKIQNTVMPKAAMSDQALENEMVAAFETSLTFRDRVKGEVMRIVIIDPDWTIRRNNLTGMILNRYIRAGIAVKNSDGSCTLWQLVTFRQDYVNDGFMPTKFDGVGDSAPIPCESVAK